jgi:hypothetical protein
MEETMNEQKWPPMTRGDLAETLREMGVWVEADRRFIVIRLVTEVYRLRAKTQRQRDRIAALLNPYSVGLPEVKPEPPAPVEDEPAPDGAPPWEASEPP